ncbi:MAG: DUF5050 domain-containing protein [Planctomycetales bacterium]|nr:DUF5050 domain-containing protein [Planctomycetales bacterium]MCA9166016.1 DUF5050 domain-containing protein [Planctomycetales bacterium]
MNLRQPLVLSVVCLISTTFAGLANAQRIYFTDTINDAIWSANADATEITLLEQSDLIEPRGISIDTINNVMYWVDYGTHQIERAKLDGSNRESVVTSQISGPRDLSLDLTNNWIYWTDRDAGEVLRSSTDGTFTQRLVTQGLLYPYTIRLDPDAQKMYWEDHFTLQLRRADTNGRNVETVIDLQDVPYGAIPVGFDIDWKQSQIYFSDGAFPQAIRRASLDGTDIKTIIPRVTDVRAITIDTKNRKLYWVEDDGTSDIMRRSNLDGRFIEDVLYASRSSIRDIAFDYRAAVYGDFDRDGQLDIDDVNSIARQFGELINRELYDLDGNQSVDARDQQYWIKNIRKTWIGDVNLDGRFDSQDIVAVFQAGEYEDQAVGNSTWASGDWNGDGDFSTKDLVLAFQDGGYGPESVGAMAVPEPSSRLLICRLLAVSRCIRQKQLANRSV